MRLRRMLAPACTTLAAALILTVSVIHSVNRADAAAKTNATNAPSIVTMRRLTESQYRNAIADIFGHDIRIGGRFDPIVRPVQDLVATGASEATISPVGFEQYDQMARDIASQVLDPQHRSALLSCKPFDEALPDPACAETFLGSVGRYVFRRPLTPSEISFYVDLASRGAMPQKSFYAGLELSLASMLVAPEFLYRTESAAPGGNRLDGYSVASRLSFLIWDSIPDETLLTAAARGDLDRRAGLKAQIDRMLASPRAEQGLRAFFTDFLQLDRVADMSKDTVVYTRFTPGVAADFQEQTLRTAVDHLLVRGLPYPDIFTTRRTFLNRRLGLIYGLPVARANGWQPYELPAANDRVGILGEGSFLALFSHEGRSSPTLRGRAIREVLLCQPVPNPPANVDFSGFNDTSNAVLKTARQRLARHATDPVCAGCHKITDPLGLPLERYDGIGGQRLTENGAAIDTAGSFEGKTFDGLGGLSGLLAKSLSPSQCFAKRALEYASGTPAANLSSGWDDAIQQAFKAGGYRYRELIEAIALSPQFSAVDRGVSNPSGQVAMLDRTSVRN